MKNKTSFYRIGYCALLLAVLLLPLFSHTGKTTPAAHATAFVKTKSDALCTSAHALSTGILAWKKGAASHASLRELYRECRMHYKSIQFFAEYYTPGTALRLNGAPLPKAEEYEAFMITEPEGFQVLEELLYAEPATTDTASLVLLSLRLEATTQRIPVFIKSIRMSDQQLLEALRQEIIRTYSLTLSGFDTPGSGLAVNEAAVQTETVLNLLQPYLAQWQAVNRKGARKLEQQLNDAITFCKKHPDFDSFDRMHFIREFADPAYVALHRMQQELQIPYSGLSSPLRDSAVSIFSTRAPDTRYFRKWKPNAPVNAEVVALGRMLFFDPVLSGNGKRSCASCHHPEKAFTDGLPTSTTFDGQNNLTRNAPTIINAGFQSLLFHDARVNFFEEQARAVISNVDELHGDLSESARTLAAIPEYRQFFRSAFSGSADTLIQAQSILHALSEYERSLVAVNSTFDRHIRGEGELLTATERDGFNLFYGKAQCGTCHFLPLFNGTVPPTYRITETEVLGVPLFPDTVKGTADTDQGRFGINRVPLHRGAFKTPGLRNVALTAPYMHHGRYKTLEEVIDFYNKGGGQGIGLDVPNQTLPGEPLHLNTYEKKAIVAFLHTLTDTSGCTAKPAYLPALPGEKEKRKVTAGY